MNNFEKIREYLRYNSPLLVFLLIIILSGIAFGTIAIRSMDFNSRQDLNNLFAEFLSGVRVINYENELLFRTAVRFDFIALLMIFMCGFIPLFLPLNLILVFLKGFVIGYSSGFLFHEYNFYGIFLSITAIFPQNLLLIPVYILLAMESIKFSMKIVAHIRKSKQLYFKDFLYYAGYYLYAIPLLLITGILEVYFVPFILSLLSTLIF